MEPLLNLSLEMNEGGCELLKNYKTFHRAFARLLRHPPVLVPVVGRLLGVPRLQDRRHLQQPDPGLHDRL